MSYSKGIINFRLLFLLYFKLCIQGFKEVFNNKPPIFEAENIKI